MEYPYLRDRVFQVANQGPRITGGAKGRNPSGHQIRARCCAIQETWTTRTERLRRSFPHEHGQHAEAELPVLEVPFVSLGDIAESAGIGTGDLGAILKRDSEPG